jgi:hypothetical protein
VIAVIQLPSIAGLEKPITDVGSIIDLAIGSLRSKAVSASQQEPIQNLEAREIHLQPAAMQLKLWDLDNLDMHRVG